MAKTLLKRSSGATPIQPPAESYTLLEAMADAVLALDRDLRISYFKAASKPLSGIRRSDVLGRKFWDVWPDVTNAIVAQEYRKALQAPNSAEFEYHSSAARKWFAVRTYAATSKDGTIWLFFHDISERKQVEHELRTAHQRTFEILEAISEGFFALDQDWRFSYVNGRAEAIWGRNKQQLLGKVIWDEFPALVGSELFVQFRRAAEDHRRSEFVARLPDERWAEVHLHPCAGGLCVYLRLLAAAESGLAERSRRKARQRIFAIQQEERQRIARELHDGTGQLLASLLVGIRTLEGARTLRQAKERIARVRFIATRLFDEIAQLTHGLHPIDLREMGLAPALEHLAADVSKTHGIRVALATKLLQSVPIDVNTEVALYRIIQEALTNTVKHAAATRARISFQFRAPMLHLTIRDDGRGFSLSGGTPASRDIRLGLHSMRERAEMLGGKLWIHSVPGRGTMIRAVIPIAASEPQ